MDAKRLSRVLQFKLRTLLLVVAGLACWLGWNLQVVEQRRATRQSEPNWSFVETINPNIAPDPPATIPWVRRIMGDVAVQRILMDVAVPSENANRAAQVFPEAQVIRGPTVFSWSVL